MEIKDLYQIYLQHPSVKTDTRKLEKGDLFFALKGPNFNGNLFAKQALESGAAYVIADDPDIAGEKIINTNYVLSTLQQLAKFHRQQFTNVPFIAITGSNGKTTTKELVHQVLSSSFITYTTQGNLNNHIGVPLTLLSVKKDAQMVVIEMGANHLKEIESYCEYSMPTYGLITNIGKAHLEGFGSEEGVRKGKGELFDYLRKNNGVAFVNNDDPNLNQMTEGIRTVISYGNNKGRVTGKPSGNTSLLEVEIQPGDLVIKSNLVGNYNLPNVLAAVTVGRYFKVEDQEIKNAIENYHPSNSRSQLIKKESNSIILDAYNANPGSMKVAIENFAGMKGENKIVMLGAMMELGKSSEAEHREIINLLGKYKWTQVVLVGENFKKSGHSYIQLDNSLQAKQWLKELNPQNTCILIKGSRSVEMEKVLEAVENV